MPVDFSGPYLKLERAEQHIVELNAIFDEYVAEATKRMRSNESRGAVTVTGGFPRHTPTVLGDAIHNLRVTLDHAYAQLVIQDGGAPTSRTVFPFGGDVQSIKSSVNGKPKGSQPAEAVVDFILDQLEPFPGGKLMLYDLHRLDILDKHEAILPVASAVHAQKVTITGPKSKIVFEGISFITQNPKATAINVIGDGMRLEDNSEFSVDILFGPRELKNRPVLQTLTTLRDNVLSALKALETLP